jgi:hypothetical protein
MKQRRFGGAAEHKPDQNWDPISRRWYPAPVIGRADDNRSREIATGKVCCLNRIRCCFDCNDLKDMILCANGLDIASPPIFLKPLVQQPLLSVPDFISLFNANCARYQIVDGVGIFDLSNPTSPVLYECYKTFSVTYASDVTPHSQCFVFHPENPRCPKFGICYFVELKPAGSNNWYFYKVSGVCNRI